jgi:hypothetical protein
MLFLPLDPGSGQCCIPDPTFSIPDTGLKIPDPRSGSKEFKDPGLDFFPSRIPKTEPGFGSRGQRAPDPGSGSANLDRGKAHISESLVTIFWVKSRKSTIILFQLAEFFFFTYLNKK